MTALTVPTLEDIRAEKARRHLKDFARLCWRTQDEDGNPVEQFIEGRHLDLIIEKLEAVERGDVRRLIIEMPPRHGKSEMVSRTFPAWFLGRNPNSEMILACYGDVLARRMSRDARTNFREHTSKVFDLALSDESAAATEWKIAGHRGGFRSAGLQGGITGMGAQVIIVDDYVKNAEEAMSEVIREKTWSEFEAAVRTRLTPTGAVIIMATRWHHDDLIGRALKHGEENGVHWERLRLPLMAEGDDPLGREEGASLWPEFGFDDEWCVQTRKEASPWLFAALYQQRPVPDKGGMFAREDLRYYTEHDDAVEVEADGGNLMHPKQFVTRHFLTVDLATSLKEMADYTVVSEWQATRYSDLLLRSIDRRRIEGPDQADLIESVWRSTGAQKVLVERIGYQLALIQELTRRGVPVIPVDPKGDKKERAIPASIKTKQHKFFIRRDMPGRQAFEDEVLSFPLGEHDDQVDTLSYAAHEIAGMTENARGFRSGGGLEQPAR